MSVKENDLISRQAAIDAYGDWYVEEGSEEGFIGTVKQLLEALPSAQPNLQPNLQPTCNQLATDCISRQAALNALFNHAEFPDKAYQAIRNLPSAQPTADVRENVKGEWVEEYDDGAPIFFKRRWVCSACGDHQTYGKPKFCPNCGADMRGGQNE